MENRKILQNRLERGTWHILGLIGEGGYLNRGRGEGDVFLLVGISGRSWSHRS